MALSELGYGFGVYNLVGPGPWNLYSTDKGGSVLVKNPNQARRGQHLRDCDQGPLLWRGNQFTNFTHHKDMQGQEYWYWDNPLLPQFSGPSRACTQPRKFYNRLVYGGLFAEELPELTLETELRINANLRLTGTVSRWQDIFDFQQPDLNGDTVVLALPTITCLDAYYGITVHKLIYTVQEICHHKRLRLRIRNKPTPQEKYNLLDTQWKYTRQPEDLCVIGVHSAIGMEVLEQGVPYVALGGHGCGPLATTWQEFLLDRVRSHSEQEFMAWAGKLLSQTWYRPDLISGLWHTRSWQQDRAQPFIPLERHFYDDKVSVAPR